jgi:hypothetical protein
LVVGPNITIGEGVLFSTLGIKMIASENTGITAQVGQNIAVYVQGNQIITFGAAGPGTGSITCIVPFYLMMSNGTPAGVGNGSMWYDYSANAIKCMVNGAVKTVTVA